MANSYITFNLNDPEDKARRDALGIEWEVAGSNASHQFYLGEKDGRRYVASYVGNEPLDDCDCGDRAEAVLRESSGEYLPQEYHDILNKCEDNHCGDLFSYRELETGEKPYTGRGSYL